MSGGELVTHGPVFTPGDEGYGAECAGFQAAYRHEPALVVGAAGPEDVRVAVRFARDRGLPVAVQATGHGLTLPARGGVLVNTRRMTGVRVDPAGATAWLAAGVTWGPVARAASEHGLAPPSGSSPGVGAVGYLLGGGIGLLARRYGYAADRVREIDLVTPDGRLRRVTPDTEPDLFWALRGGAGNFGVVVGMRVGLLPVRRIYGGGLYFAPEHAGEVLAGYLGWTRTLPDELTSSIASIPFPDRPPVPEPLRGRRVLHVRIAYTGDPAGGDRLLAPLRGIAPRLLDTVAELPYREAGSIYQEPAEPMPYVDSSALLGPLEPAAARAVLDALDALDREPAGGPFVELRHLGGALARRPAVPSCIGNRDAHYALSIRSVLGAGPPGTPHRDLLERLRRWTTGGQALNFVAGRSDPGQRVRAAFEPADYRRLVEVKRRYDPDNTFRFNHNIRPELVPESEVKLDSTRDPDSSYR